MPAAQLVAEIAHDQFLAGAGLSRQPGQYRRDSARQGSRSAAPGAFAAARRAPHPAGGICSAGQAARGSIRRDAARALVDGAGGQRVSASCLAWSRWKICSRNYSARFATSSTSKVPDLTKISDDEWAGLGRGRARQAADALAPATRFEVYGGGKTLSSLILRRLGRVPRAGEKLKLGEFEATAERVRGATVEHVRLRR